MIKVALAINWLFYHVWITRGIDPEETLGTHRKM